MAAMTTALIQRSDERNARVWEVTGHTVQKPKLMLQKRVEPKGNQSVAEDEVMVLFGAADSTGVILPTKTAISAKIRRSTNAVVADTDAAIALFREFVASDEFAAVMNSQRYIEA